MVLVKRLNLKKEVLGRLFISAGMFCMGLFIFLDRFAPAPAPAGLDFVTGLLVGLSMMCNIVGIFWAVRGARDRPSSHQVSQPAPA